MTFGAQGVGDFMHDDRVADGHQSEALERVQLGLGSRGSDGHLAG